MPREITIQGEREALIKITNGNNITFFKLNGNPLTVREKAFITAAALDRGWTQEQINAYIQGLEALRNQHYRIKQFLDLNGYDALADRIEASADGGYLTFCLLNNIS